MRPMNPFYQKNPQKKTQQGLKSSLDVLHGAIWEHIYFYVFSLYSASSFIYFGFLLCMYIALIIFCWLKFGSFGL